MSQQLPPGWVDALASAVKSGDEKTRSEALGVKPRRCFRRSSDDTFTRSRKRGSARGHATRYALKELPPVDAELPPLPEDE
jgi:hypothetical protein